MKKKILACILVLGAVACLSSCKEEAPPAPTDTNIPYEALYAGASTQIHDPVAPGQLTRASYGYLFNTQQGYNGFFYVAGSAGSTRQLTWNGSRWEDGAASLENGVISAGEEPCGYVYEASAAGSFRLEGTLASRGQSGGSLTVYHNGEQIFPAEGVTFSVEGNDPIGRWFSCNVELKVGDTLYFAVKGEGIYCNPTIVPLHFRQSLYVTGTKSGFYGDIHVYYHNGQVHLYHLWNYGTDTAIWEWGRQVSTDMFRFADASMDLSFVQDHYMALSPDLIDYPAYVSGRDCTKFFDPDIGRYRYLALSYRPSQGDTSCALTLRTSRDAIGMDWSDPCVVLRDFPTGQHGEPECSQLKKIGDRWYLFTSVSGQTAHGVGTVQYFVGGEGQTIDEVDWQSLEPHFLDGEDLCVPQVEAIADRYYLFGWMPRAYSTNYWGGYKNLPREIYQLPDGTLGSRLDPMATALLNKGRYFAFGPETAQVTVGLAEVTEETVQMLGKDNRVALSDPLDSTFLTYSLQLRQATQAGFTMTVGNLEYRILLLKEGEDVYMQIDCPSDPRHPISSRLKIRPADVYTVKCTVEGDIVEFFVNDTYALSGRTSMAGKVYAGSFVANGNALFTDIQVCRLAQMYDIYD